MEETAIDLDDVEFETAEPRKACKSRSEVIQPDLNAQVSQPLHVSYGLRLQKDVASFGDLDGKLLWRKAVPTEDLSDPQ